MKLTTTGDYFEVGGTNSATGYITLTPNYKCPNAHRFFVAETAASGGNVHIIAICTDCGEGILRTFKISEDGSAVSL
jgi:hypothetical protein